jgi:hypothetical protein
MVLFDGNSGTTRASAETAFDSGTDAPVLLPVKTEWRKDPDFVVRNCAEKSPLISQGTARSLSLPQGIESVSEIRSLVNAF